jgi:hypothetical protein
MTAPGIAIPPSSTSPRTAPASEGRTTLHGILLACGIAAPLLYVAMLVFVPRGWLGYSSAAQTVSELSAIDAPTRSLWVTLGLVWTLLYAAFGWGVWRSGGPSRALRVAGAAIIVAAVFGLFWPPMHRREVLAAGGGTLTDTLHIVWTAVNGVLTLAAMGFAAAAFGKRFRRYSIATMVVLLAAGAVSSLDASRLQANLPTPWVGVWERVNIAAWLVWVVVLALAVRRRRPAAVAADRVQAAVEMPDGKRAVVASR